MEDWDLIQEFVATGADPPFTVILRRHLDLVYSAAIRHVHDAHMAEDITQTVFALLARRAARLKPGVILAGWLLQATRYVCLDTLRTGTSRARAEKEAARLRPSVTPAPASS
jgi:DNA-directed RNA polymerase specialized sigma24 family protein